MKNNLFTPLEYEQILLHSTWSDEEKPDERTLWVQELNEITNYLVREKASEDCTDVFVPFLKFIEERTSFEIGLCGICMKDIFAEGAFDEYLKGIRDFMTSSWSEITKRLLNRQNEKKEMSFGERNRYIRCGRHFHDCVVEYPLYARMLTEYVFSVISETLKIVKRVSIHRETVFHRFCNAKADIVPRISCISKPLSDRHNGGQTVRILTFEGGFRVVYKPRALQVENAFADWITYLCNVASKAPLMTPEVMDCGEYGFVQYIESYSFQSSMEVADFFYREGLLFGAIYLLQGLDIHAENIIAARDPVVIDAECIFKVDRRNNLKQYNIVSTAGPPYCIAKPAYYPVSTALCGREKGSFNLPVLNGKCVPAYDYYEDFIHGFEDCLRAATRKPENTCEKLREIFFDIPVRILPLSTVAYFLLQQALCKPDRLRGTQVAEHSISVITQRAEAQKMNMPNLEMLERNAARKLDIPHVTQNVDTLALQNIKEHILSIDAENIERQKQYIAFLLGPAVFPKNSLKLCKAKHDDRTLIHELAQNVYRSLESDIGVVVPRNSSRPYIAGLRYQFAEGKLGAITALAACLVCYEDKIEDSVHFREAVENQLRNYNQRADFDQIFSISEPGLAEGMGGTLILACLLYDFGVLERKAFEKIAEEMVYLVHKSLNEKRMFTFFHSFLYHCDGLCFALQRASAQKGIREELRTKLFEVSKEFADAINYSGTDANERLKSELLGAFERYDSLAVSQMAGAPFIGFFFGTAGKLFRLCLAHFAEYSGKEAKEYSELSFWKKLLIEDDDDVVN